MRGNLRYQVDTLFHQTGQYKVGESRHAAKVSALDNIPKGQRTSTNIARQTGVHSVKYTDQVKSSWQRMGDYAKANYKIKDMTKIEARHIQGYLEKHMERVSSYKSWSVEASRIAKFENALHKFTQDKSQDLRNSIEKVREVARAQLGEGRRISGYEKPESVIDNLKPEHQLAAKLQLEGGCRKAEATQIKQSQLKGIQVDKITGERRGVIALENTKGGKDRDTQISEKTYRELEARTANENFKVNQSSYRADVARSAVKCGERYTRTHSFRHNYASARYSECLKSGCNDAQAMQQVSWELGHERAEVTNDYLR